jgi:hypothetical protein
MPKVIKEKKIDTEIVRFNLNYEWKNLILIVIIASVINLGVNLGLLGYSGYSPIAWVFIAVSIATSLLVLLFVIKTLMNPKIDKIKENIEMNLK